MNFFTRLLNIGLGKIRHFPDIFKPVPDLPEFRESPKINVDAALKRAREEKNAQRELEEMKANLAQAEKEKETGQKKPIIKTM